MFVTIAGKNSHVRRSYDKELGQGDTIPLFRPKPCVAAKKRRSAPHVT